MTDEMKSIPREQRDPRRKFSRDEQAALFRNAGGKCEKCGELLDENWHADHKHPHAHGGATDVRNGQALCRRCNLNKGSRTEVELYAIEEKAREWQRRALGDLLQAVDKGTGQFLAHVTTAAGKTKYSLLALKWLLEKGLIDHVVIVVPSRQLKRQMARNAKKLGINLTAKYCNSKAARMAKPSDTQGVVVTYAQVASEPAFHRLHCARNKTMVILDEIHHGASEKNWGKALLEAFEDAKLVLGLSGTLFRGDSETIPFVKYENGRSVSDFSYAYGEALRDGVVRPIEFPQYEGNIQFADRTGIVSTTFNEELDKTGESRRLRTALLADGKFIETMIKEAYSCLLELRKAGHPDAGMLIFAIDKAHAFQLEKAVKDCIGVEAVVVVSSEDEQSSRKIDRFTDSNEPVMIAVRMVNEGVDIPRLRVGVYATSVATELFFRQSVGRFIRKPDGSDEGASYLWMPQDERLVDFAKAFADERDHVLLSSESEIRESPGPSEPIDPQWTPLSAEAVVAGIIYAGEAYLPEELRYAEDLLRRSSENRMSAVSPTQLAAMLRELEKQGVIPATISSDRKPPVEDLEVDSGPTWDDANEALRSKINGLVNLLARRTGEPHDEIHRGWMQRGNPSQLASSNDDLNRKINWLEKKLTRVGEG